MAAADASTTPDAFDRVASQKRADLVQQQWDDYKQRFQPVETQIINQMGHGTQSMFNDQGIAEAQSMVNTAYDNSVGSTARDVARYGINLTPGQKTANDMSTALSKSTSMANATNTARQWDQDRRNAVMSGGLGNASTIGRA